MPQRRLRAATVLAAMALSCAAPALAVDVPLPALPTPPASAALGAPVPSAMLAALRGGVASLDSRVAVSVLVRPALASDAAAAAAAAPLAVYLQNSTDNRQLQVQRVIDVQVDSLQRLSAITWQRQLLGGVITSLQR